MPICRIQIDIFGSGFVGNIVEFGRNEKTDTIDFLAIIIQVIRILYVDFYTTIFFFQRENDRPSQP